MKALLISLAANILTELGKNGLMSILVEKDQVKKEITNAYINALKKWTINYSIRKFEMSRLSERRDKLLDALSKGIDLDDETDKFLVLFEDELRKSTVTWKYIQNKQFKEAIMKLNETSGHIDELKQSRLFLPSEFHELFVQRRQLEHLIEFEEYFSIYTNSPNGFYKNSFFNRIDEIRRLKEWLKKPDKSIITIHGTPGVGASRLVYETFKQINKEEGNDVELLVLEDGASQNIEVIRSLEDTVPFVILIDAAFKVSFNLQSVVRSVLRKNNVKLVLTIYTSNLEELNRTLVEGSSEKYEYLEITNFGHAETREWLQNEIPGIRKESLLDLSELTAGNPTFVNSIIQAVKAGLPYSEIINADNFRSVVWKTLENQIDFIESRTRISKPEILKVLTAIATVGPITKNNDFIGKCITFFEIGKYEFEIILTYLEESGIVSSGWSYKLVPPVLGSIILHDSRSIGYVKKIADSDSEEFLNNLLMNLSSLPVTGGMSIDVDSILDSFISILFRESYGDFKSKFSLNSKLRVLQTFAHQKPQKCLSAISKLITRVGESSEFWHNKVYSNAQESIIAILKIIALNTSNRFDFDDLYEVIQKYSSFSDSLTVYKKVFSYTVYDFEEFGYLNENAFNRQHYVLEKLKVLTSSQNDIDKQVVVTIAQAILSQEFHSEPLYDSHSNSFQFGHYSVNQNPDVIKLRIKLIKLLVDYYMNVRHSVDSQLILDVIVTVFFSMAKSQGNRNEIKRDEEVLVVKGLIELMMENNPTIDERSTVNQQLRLFQRREIKPEYIDLQEYLQLLVTKVYSRLQKLELIVSGDPLIGEDGKEERIDEIISLYDNNAEELANDILFCTVHFGRYASYNFQEILNHLGNSKQDLSRSIFSWVIENRPNEAHFIANLARAFSEDDDFFYSVISRMWDVGSPESMYAVVWMLTSIRKGVPSLRRTQDFEYFEEALEKNEQKCLILLSYNIADYLDFDPSRCLKVASVLIHLESNSEHEFLIGKLFEKEKNKELYQNELKDFIWTELHSIDISSHYFDRVFYFLENYFGFNSIIAFLKHREQIKEHFPLGHQLFFNSRYSNSTPDEAVIHRNFLDMVKWYVGTKKRNKMFFIKVVKHFQPLNLNLSLIETEVLSYINGLLSTKKIKAIVYTFECLAIGSLEDENNREFLLKTASRICELMDLSRDELTKMLGENFIRNLGMKSKSGKGAFPSDLAKRDLLTGFIENSDMHEKIRDLLKLSLKQVNKEIEREELDKE